jgi:hypothetical protein
MQMAFTPSTIDVETIEKYRAVIETSYHTNNESIRIIDERIKTLNKNPKLDSKTKRYTEQLGYILCDIEPLTCPLIVTQPL